MSTDKDYVIIENAVKDQIEDITDITIDRDILPSQGVLEMKTAEKGIPIRNKEVYKHLNALKNDIDGLMHVCSTATQNDNVPVSVRDRIKAASKMAEGSSALEQGTKIKIVDKPVKGDATKRDLWIFVIPCNKDSERMVSDVQVTIDLPLSSIANPKTAFVERAVTRFIRETTAGKIETAFLKHRKETLKLPDIDDKELQSFWLLASYWAARGHGQKTSMTCLPKVNMCELFKKIQQRSGGKQKISKDEALAFQEVMADPEVTDGSITKIQAAHWYLGDLKKKCPATAVFNMHAGAFAIKNGDGRDGIEIALEIRQANKVEINGVVGYDAARVLKGEVTVNSVVGELSNEYDDAVKQTMI